MGNRTIYLKEDSLWDRVKQAAGRDGMSRLVEQALEEYLAKKKREEEGFEVFRIEVNQQDHGHGPAGSTDRIAFEGRLIAREFFHGAGGDTDNPDVQKGAAVYRTKGGRLVLLVDEYPPNRSLRHAVYATFSELRGDPVFSEIDAAERAAFFDELRSGLGEDWALWID